MTEKLPEVQIYTDGACSGNPGPGGYGAILKYGDHMKEISGGYRHTTNNRMELTAVIKGLQQLRKPCSVTIYSDSRYIVDAINLGWVKKWMGSGWVKPDKAPVKNVDLWKELVRLLKPHNVTWVWIKGHSDNEFNNRCDRIAVNASKEGALEIDRVYEEEQPYNG
ncbi:MAG: ribonuclease HI [Bacillota bacterium]